MPLVFEVSSSSSPTPRVSKVKRVKCVRGKILDREEYTEHIFFIVFCTLTRFVSSSLQKVDAVAREREERERERDDDGVGTAAATTTTTPRL